MKKFSAIVLIFSIFVSLISAPVMANETEHLTGDFVDIGDHWAYDQMSQLIAMGIMKGYTETVWDEDLGENIEAQKVRPDQNITRAEFAVLLYQALNLDSVTESAQFSDVIPSWAAEAVNSLRKEGIIGGYPDGTFRPSNNISRAEIVSMLVRALNNKETQNGKQFADVSSGHWAYSSIQTASGMGIVNGFSNGTFKPQRGALRGEVMVMIYQFLLNDKSEAPSDSLLLSRAEEELKIMESAINSSGDIDLSSILPLATGEHELLIPEGEAALNELKENGSLAYKVTYPGKVVRKSDRLAELVFETTATFKADDSTIERDLKEHYFLMKIGNQWYIYSTTDEDLL